MLETYEAVLLFLLPYSFTSKSLALGVMWWHLRFRTISSGPLGDDINIEFRDQFTMSLFITLAMVILSQNVEPGDVEWPWVSLVLSGLALFPFKAAWSHFRVYRRYVRIARDRAIQRASP